MAYCLVGGTSKLSRHFAKFLENRGEPYFILSKELDPEMFDLNKFATRVIHEFSTQTPEVVVNFVGFKGDSLEESMRWNYQLTRLLLDACRLSGVKKVVLIGSAAEYGLSNHPIYFSEEMTLKPSSAYGESKALQSSLVSAHEYSDLTILYLRVFNVWGSEMSRQTLSGYLEHLASLDPRERMAQQLLDSNSIRDFVHVSTFCEKLFEAAKNTRCSLIVNLGSGRPLSIQRFALDFLHELGIDRDLPEFHQSNPKTYSVANIARLELLTQAPMDYAH